MEKERICMWSGPRNVSTAFMYSFASRGDCQVVDEPFYGYYLHRSGIDHPMRAETLEVMATDYETVLDKVVFRALDNDFLFLKNMPHHLVDCSLDFAIRLNNFFLIRDPGAMIASFIKKIPDPTMSDLGLEQQWRLYERLVEAGHRPAVVDSADLLDEPEGILRQLCRRLDIPFSAKMLKWEAGPIPEDGPWADYWYANVHASTGFTRPETSVKSGGAELPGHLHPLLEECRKYYDRLHQFRLTL